MKIPAKKKARLSPSVVVICCMNQINVCCADCGEEGGPSLKTCKSCMLVKYCNADCQRNHWPIHKKECKQRAAEFQLRDEALFKDPPAKEDCPICFLPMPVRLICCMSLPPATITSVPICDFAIANKELTNKTMKQYYSCCGKGICGGCVHSFVQSGNKKKCPFCKADHVGKTDEERITELMKRVEVNDAGAIFMLAGHYELGRGLSQDRARAIALLTQAAELGSSPAHYNLGNDYRQRGDMKKAKFHWEATAMAGHEGARHNLGCIEFESGNKEQSIKHWTIAASAGEYMSMQNLLGQFKQGFVSRDTIDSILTAYNNSCAEMRSEARDAYINTMRTRPI